MIFIFTSFGVESESRVLVPEHLKIKEPTMVSFPKNEIRLNPQRVAPPFLGSTYNGFKEALAFKESQGNYFSINTFGYLGKYQFGISTLQSLQCHQVPERPDATGEGLSCKHCAE